MKRDLETGLARTGVCGVAGAGAIVRSFLDADSLEGDAEAAMRRFRGVITGGETSLTPSSSPSAAGSSTKPRETQ